ncbi:MAG: sulfate adenylyltransferase subunit CysD [Polyangiales bacterium]
MHSEAAPMAHLRQLEAESIHIIREVAAEFERPVLLYSMGKDSSVLAHLAMKAFRPAPLPFPLLQIQTTWEFREMTEFREEFSRRHGVEVLVHTNEEALGQGVNPFEFSSQQYTSAMITQSLVGALKKHRFDAALGGARRDEERSRAKERVYSFRDRFQQWDPKNQRPELWNLYNGRVHAGESIRAFPLSNWTELDIWQYIWLENIPLVPLYYAAPRPVVRRGEAWIMVDDERLPLSGGEQPEERQVRFRTLGCYPLTGAIESDADSVPKIIAEMLEASHSERQGRLIDYDEDGSMERKKREGYF